MSIELTDAGRQALLDNDTPTGLHVAVSWRPLPLRMWGDVTPGAPWLDTLMEASREAFRDEIGILQPWDVEFQRHEGEAANCSRCAALQGQRFLQRATGTPGPARMPARTADLADDCLDPALNLWTGPSGEVSWRTEGLFFTAVVSDDNDWLLPLARVVDDGVRYLASNLSRDDLEFEEL